ncbi:MAG TPA: hypothetical protein VFY69_08220 [Solirubrobacterales bacterium]|nr:hypothetical protein [Solirubrobacterales bacterium]
MSTSLITISAEDRDLIYHRILLHLSGIDAVWLAARHHDFSRANQLSQEFCDELHLVMDDLGWGETRGDEPVNLTSSPEALRRVFERMRDVASEEDEHIRAGERAEPDAPREREEENRQVRAVCERVLAALDGSAAGGRRGA